MSKKNADEPEVPKVTKALPVIAWTESFKDYLWRVIGVRNVPLAYVIREQVVPDSPEDLVPDQPYSRVAGSIEAELVQQASHSHGLFKDDNTELYFKLEEAVRGTIYANSIRPFQKKRDGRGAWFAISRQYAGPDKCELELKNSKENSMSQEVERQ